VENPDTVAKSLAIGDPGDGRYVLKRLKQYNGIAEQSNNKEILIQFYYSQAQQRCLVEFLLHHN